MSAEPERQVGREMPAALMRWTSPEHCADELLEVFGRHWCRILSIELRSILKDIDR